ncbi:MAG: chemotaxis protein CheV [Gammaproteobacteria bacterium]|nr:chemotaxis protein CheV [Gammaproteobacteria bacterium]
MANFIQSVDERTRLAGANRLEVLLFTLGRDRNTGREEKFGINVFKVREVLRSPDVVKAPDMPPGVEGMVSLRGTMIPVVDLAHFCEIDVEEKPLSMIVTEYNRSMQGFLVHAVDQILRMEWNQIKVPPTMMSHRHGGLINAVAELEGGTIVMMMDVEKVLEETSKQGSDPLLFDGIEKVEHPATIFYADDSSVARKQIERTLDKMGLNHIAAINGKDAWQKLGDLAERAKSENRPLTDLLQVILTDIEMPEMDGFVLTRQIKQDKRFDGIPVIMHSSLSADANVNLGKSVGADGYVAKFSPRDLAAAIAPHIKGKTEKELIEKLA